MKLPGFEPFLAIVTAIIGMFAGALGGFLRHRVIGLPAWSIVTWP